MALAAAEQEAPFVALKRPKDHRKCVGVMLLNARNEVFVACRADGSLLDKGDDGLAGKSLWQCPQGGIDKGEDFLVAAKRELYEETGITSVEVIGEARGGWDGGDGWEVANRSPPQFWLD
jgi:8-oxo-dGTP pyrophosphatase MutT (NUDIX family)